MHFSIKSFSKKIPFFLWDFDAHLHLGVDIKEQTIKMLKRELGRNLPLEGLLSEARDPHGSRWLCYRVPEIEVTEPGASSLLSV